MELDLHRTLMRALKLRDERQLSEQKQREETERIQQLMERYAPSAVDEARPQLFETIVSFIDGQRFVQHVAILDDRGKVIVDGSQRGKVPPHAGELRDILCGLVDAYPRRGLTRMFLDDSLGTVVLQRLSRGGAVLVVAGQRAPMGAVAMAVNKLAVAAEQHEGKAR
jgi:hypothetical protein